MIFKEMIPEPARSRVMESEIRIPGPDNLIECKESLIEGMMNCWYEYIPSSYNGSKKLPLVIEIHGGLLDGRRTAAKTGWHFVAEKEEFIVVYPNSLLFEHWLCDERDILYLERLIYRICEKYAIDTERIYMQGFSNGDVMTQAFAQSKGELLAAAGFISGPSGKEFLKDTSVVLPVIQMRGEKDVLNGGENWEENPYEVRDELNELNRSFWLKANRTCTIPEVYIWGKHNMARYAGCADVIFYEVKDVPHKETVELPQIFWDYCYSRYCRKEKEIVELKPFSEPMCHKAFVLAVGSEKVWCQEGCISMAEESNARVMYIQPQTNSPVHMALESDCNHQRAVYAPITLLDKVFPVEVQISGGGERAEVIWKDGNKLIFGNGMEAVFKNNNLEGMNKPALYYCGIFYIPIEEVLETWFSMRISKLDDVLYCSSNYARLAHGTAEILRKQLGGVRLCQPEK